METWYLMDGAEHKQTWYLVNGTEQNKTRVLLAGEDCDGVGHVKCVLERASDIVPQMDDGTQVYRFGCDWPSKLECNYTVQSGMMGYCG